MGLALAPLLGAKLIYHNEGFYPDEQVDAGVWAKNSRPHRVAKSLEQRMYSRSDAIIALSNRAKNLIEEIDDVRRKQTPVIVVPSCVDLDLFSSGAARSLAPRRDDAAHLCRQRRRALQAGPGGGFVDAARSYDGGVATAACSRAWTRGL